MTDQPLTAASEALRRYIQTTPLILRDDLTQHLTAIEAQAAERATAPLLAALSLLPEDLPSPTGKIVWKWWRLGWLSAYAVIRAALTEAEP